MTLGMPVASERLVIGTVSQSTITRSGANRLVPCRLWPRRVGWSNRRCFLSCRGPSENRPSARSGVLDEGATFPLRFGAKCRFVIAMERRPFAGPYKPPFATDWTTELIGRIFSMWVRQMRIAKILYSRRPMHLLQVGMQLSYWLLKTVDLAHFLCIG